MGNPDNLPNPAKDAAALWMSSLDRDQLHGVGWVEVNRRLNGITMAARIFVREHFPPEEQEAAFDGLTLGLLAMTHFGDIRELAERFGESNLSEQEAARHELLPPDITN